jgi:hypothetical protein
MTTARKELAAIERAREAREVIATELAACAERVRVLEELRSEAVGKRDELMRGAIIAGYSQADVARMCGLTPGRVTQLVAGK